MSATRYPRLRTFGSVTRECRARYGSRLGAGTPEAPMPSRARRQLRDLFELHGLDALKYQLRDPHASLHHDRLGAEVDHRDQELPPVVRVDGSGRVRQREPVLQCEARPGAHLCFVPRWDGEREPGSDETTLERLEREVGIGAGQIVPRGTGRLPGRQGQSVMMREPQYLDRGRDVPLGHQAALARRRFRQMPTAIAARAIAIARPTTRP